VDATNPDAGVGSAIDPFRTLQDAIQAATANLGQDDIFVYGNTSGDPQDVYVWTRDGDQDGDGFVDGNMKLEGTDRLFFRSVTLLQGPAGTPAPIVVKLANNFIDIAGTGALMRVEGDADNPVTFTSVQDDSAGGDTNGDGTNSAPNRLDWGGIRFRAGAADQGLGSSSGAFINFADIRYTGQTLFDEVIGDQTEFSSIRMEGETNGTQACFVRVWNTTFQHGGKALDVHFRAMEGFGPDIGSAQFVAPGVRDSTQPLTFLDNSINGLFVHIPIDPVLQIVPPFDVDAEWDDIGIPYVLTQRMIVTGSLIVDQGMIVKSRREQMDFTTDPASFIQANGTVNQPILFTAITDDDPGTLLAPFYDNGTQDTSNDGNQAPVRGDWGGIRVDSGIIEHAIIRWGGGETPLNGFFNNRPALHIITPGGQTFQVSNSEITETLGAVPAIDVSGTGTITIIDNTIHDNGSLAILAASNTFGAGVHPLGGYGMHVRRNIFFNNANNGVFATIITGTGYIDDTDVVLTIGNQISATGANVVRQIQSRRTVSPTINLGYLDRYQGVGIGNAQFATFVNQLTAQGALQGPVPTNNDNLLYHNFLNFTLTARGVTLPGQPIGALGNVRGEEWRDWGVDFIALNNATLFPFKTLATGGAVSGGTVLTTSNVADNDSSMQMVFDNLVNAVGFWVTGNASNVQGGVTETIEFYGDQNQLLETITLPTTAGGPVFIGRVSRAPIYRVVIHENANDGDTMGIDDLYYVESSENLVIKMDAATFITSSGFDAVDLRNNNLLSVGPTLRILGQPNNPVQITSLNDDSTGAGIFGFVQNDTNGNGAGTGSPGEWVGIQFGLGINTNKTEFVSQLPSGTVLRQTSDANPYTIGDEPGSLPDTVSRSVGGQPVTQLLQDGTLIEHSDIRFADIGIDYIGYPDGKLLIEGSEIEDNAGGIPGSGAIDNDSVPNAQVLLPATLTSGRATRISGTSFFTGNVSTAFDEDYFRVTNQNPGNGSQYLGSDFGFNATQGFLPLYLDVDHTSNDTDVGGQFNIYGYNFQNQLVFINSRDLQGGTANYMGPTREYPGNRTADFADDPAATWDIEYVVVAPRGTIPTVMISDQITIGDRTGELPDGNSFQLIPIPNGEGFMIIFRDQDGNIVNTTQSSLVMVDPAFNSPQIWTPIHNAVSQGYELEVRPPVVTGGIDRHQGRGQDAVRNLDGDLLFRQNLIRESFTSSIFVHDTFFANLHGLGQDLFPQTGRYLIQNTERDNAGAGAPFTNPNNYLPGAQIYNNTLMNGQGIGVWVQEDITHPQPNLPNPTGYHQILHNTIHNNIGNAIDITSRGGPNVLNNVLTRNNTAVRVVDLGNTPGGNSTVVVNYNLTFQNSSNISGNTNPPSPGSNLLNVDPLFVDAPNFDLRIFGFSPAVDAALSNLSDRLFQMRHVDVPTRMPTDDGRDKDRIDNPFKSNVGSGQFPFYDIGAWESNESPLRVIALRPFFTTTVVPGPVGSFEIDFAGRVDPATLVISDNISTPSVDERTIMVTKNGVFSTITLVTNTYDKVRDIHTFRFTFDAPIGDGTYNVFLDGTSVAGSPAIRDITGQLLDGEFPAPATAPAFSFPSGNNVPGGDFNYQFIVVTSSIGDLVWNDIDGDRFRDPGEPGIANVRVRLREAGQDGLLGTADDIVFTPNTTNALGAYSFANLTPGLYRVSIVQSTLPVNFVLTNPPEPRDITLGIDEDRLDVDFGYWQDLQNASIGDLVWNDVNGDGVRAPSEPGIVGVFIELVGSGPDRTLGTGDDVFFPPVQSTAGGAYSFPNLPAWDYRVTVDLSSPALIGFGLTTGNSPLLLSLTPGQVVNTADFGFQQKNAKITGLAFEDTNADGDKDIGENGFINARIFIDADDDNLFDPGERFTTSAADGSGTWTIDALASGTYKVMVEAASLPGPLPWVPTTTHPRNVTVPAGQTVTGVDFGFQQDPGNAQILGRVFSDLDGDGAFNGADTGLAGLNVLVTWAGLNGVFGDFDDVNYGPFITNPAGQFQTPANLASGNYLIDVLNPPAGFVLTTQGGDPINRTLNPSEIYSNALFGYQQQEATITGVVFGDLNGNGVLNDPPESARFVGVTIWDDRDDDNVIDAIERQATSGLGGAFSITQLGVGQHRLKVLASTLPAGFGPTNTPLLVTVNTPTETVPNQNIGLRAQNGIIRGQVFLDSDGDGFRDPGEDLGVTNALVQIDVNGNGFDPSDPSVVTANDGLYSFGQLFPGTYAVRVTPPAPGVVTTTNPAFVTTDGNSAATQDFGVTGLQGGIFYLTFATGGTVTNSNGSTRAYTSSDILKLKVNTDGTYTYTVYFKGSKFGLSDVNERIDAFYIVPSVNTPPGFTPGQVLISTAGPFAVQTTYTATVPSGAFITGFGEDVLRFTPTAYNAKGKPKSGNWALQLDGSTRGLSGAAGNVDGVAVREGTGHLLVSISSNLFLPASGLTVNGEDIIRLNPATNTFAMFFDGSNVGLGGSSLENVDAIHVVGAGNNPIIYLSTSGPYSVPGLTGGADDVFKFNAATLGQNTTTGVYTAPAFLDGNLFGHGTKNVTGFQFGLAPFDLPQVQAGTHASTDSESVAVRWDEAVSEVAVYIDPTNFRPGQVRALRRALDTANDAWAATTGKHLIEVSTPAQADIVLRGEHLTPIGGKADGVLAYASLLFDIGVSGLLANGTPFTEFVGGDVAGAGTVTFVTDWAWFSRKNANLIRPGQFDLETTALHELGHVLGLTDVLHHDAAMDGTLTAGTVQREFTDADLAALGFLYGEPGTATSDPRLLDALTGPLVELQQLAQSLVHAKPADAPPSQAFKAIDHLFAAVNEEKQSLLSSKRLSRLGDLGGLLADDWNLLG
jgi:hypothetical protein